MDEEEQERVKDIINDINEDVKMPPYDGDQQNKEGYTRQYQEYKEEEREEQELSQYEQLCYRMASLFNLSADESTKEKLNPPIQLMNWEITPGMVLSATAGVGFFSFTAWFIVFMLNTVVIHLIPTSLLLITVLAPVGVSAYTYYKPIFAAKDKVIRSSGEMILSILYMVVYMRSSPNLEGAIRFAALNLEGPISKDLKRVLWNVEVGNYNNIEKALEDYTERWKDYNEDYLESLNLIKASMNEPNPDRRDELLQDSIDTILNSTQEKMKHYAQSLHTPVSIINALGAMLPVLAMIMLPLISVFMGGAITPLHLIIIFNIMLPITLWIFMQRVLSSRPPTVSSKAKNTSELPPEGHFNLNMFGNEYQLPSWPIGAAVGLLVSAYGIIGYILFPAFYPVDISGGMYVPGLFTSAGRLTPFPMLLRSISITFGVGLGIGIWKALGYKDRKAAEEEIRDIESQFPNALFQLGNKISGGTPIELALEQAAESTSDLEISGLFNTASRNIEEMGMTFEQALFHEKYGAVEKFPSQLIDTVMRAILESSEKGTQLAATAMMTISRYLKNIHKTQEKLNDLMEDATTTLEMLAYLLAPVVSGVAVGMSQTIITAMYRLSQTFQQGTAKVQGGSGAGSGAAAGGQVGSYSSILGGLKNAIPPELLQFVVGFYLIQLLYILGTFYMKITEGEDQTYKNLFIGKILISGMFFYTITLVTVALMFGGLVSGMATAS
ncbi:MAG: hypothetical protein ABEK04_05210 [Candidatus Nanohalobium sp.]